MNCSMHPQKEAMGTCVYCGRLFCEDCLVEIDNKYYCKEHVKLLIQNNKNNNDNNNSNSGSFPPHNHAGGNQNKNYNYDYSYSYGNPPNPSATPPYQPNIYVNNNNVNNDYGYPPYYYHRKSRLIALLLCIFFGLGGFHRFYVGKIGTGIVWFFTGGCFFIGWIIDVISILVGTFRDANGQYLD